MKGKSFSLNKKRILLIILFLFILAIFSYYFLNSSISEIFYDPKKLDSLLSGFGFFAPLIFISLMILQIIFAPIPGHLVYLAGGYVFGTIGGFFYGLIGLILGTFIAIAIGRWLGRPFVEKFVSQENLKKFDEVTYDYGLIAIFVLFLLPGLPDDALCFLAGLTTIDLNKLMIAVVAGRVPGLIAMVFAGESLANSDWIIFLVVIAIVAVFSYIAIKYRERIMSFQD